MKNLLLFVAFFICAQIFCIDASSKRHLLDIKAIEKAILSKCVTDDNVQKFENIFSDYRHCKARSMEDYPISFEHYENNTGYCTFLKESEFRVCIKNFTTNISPCFTEEEIYIPNFLLNAFDIGYEQLCGINGARNTEYLYHKINGSQECLQICGHFFFDYGSCTANLNVFKDLDKGILNLKKPDVCQDLKSLQKCTTQVLEGVCNAEFSPLTELIFRPFLENCNNLNTITNVF